MTKRLVLCFDGTWNKLDSACPTNVVLTAESILPSADVAQLVFYDEGPGTIAGQNFRGGVFGMGVTQNLSDAYRFLIFNYTPGDEIFIFGFSRGAYTARSFVGLLRNCGIIARRHAARANEAIALYRDQTYETEPDGVEMSRWRSRYSPDICVNLRDDGWRANEIPGYKPGSAPRLQIAYLGLWDTVGALGVPGRFRLLALFNHMHQFHDVKLSKQVLSARHAIAIDERRRDFSPTLWDNIEELNTLHGRANNDPEAPFQQQWFPGVHGAVGGGGPERGLSDQSLDWIWDGAREQGLRLDDSEDSTIYGLSPDWAAPLDNCPPPKNEGLGGRVKRKAVQALFRKTDRLPGPSALPHVSASARRRWHLRDDKGGHIYRPPTLEAVSAALDKESLPMAPPVSDIEFDIITVQPGDTLGRIARARLGAAGRYMEIVALNPKIADPDRIYVGQALRVPRV